MNSKQTFMIVAIVTALSVAMIATPVMAQNMTGGNMTNATGSISSGEGEIGEKGEKFCDKPC